MIRYTCSCLFTACLLTISLFTTAQNMSVNGRFNSRHFSVDDYGSAAQIFGGEQGSDGIVYFGNRVDILSYDGVSWKRIKTDAKKINEKTRNLVEKTKVRKLFRSSDDVIYVGRENNFGFIAYSDSGLASYYPIYVEKKIGEMGPVWNIFELANKELLFAGENYLFRVANKKADPITLPTTLKGFACRTSCRLKEGILLIYTNQALGDERKIRYFYYDFKTGKLREQKLPEHIKLSNVRGSFEANGVTYLLDISGKFYSVKDSRNQLTWNKPTEAPFSGLNDFSPNYVSRHGNYIYLGTETNGLVISDLGGTIIRRIDSYDELESQDVFFHFHDKKGNLWLCLDNGIQVFETSSPVTFFKKKEGISSLTEAMDFNSGELLIASHTDLLTPEKINTHTNFVSKNLMNQSVYDIETFETSQGKKTLIVGYEGLYEYLPLKNTVRKIAPPYAWKYRQDPDNKDVVYCTLERGIGKLELQKDGSWKYTDLLTDAGGETFSLVIHHHKIYFGIQGIGVGIYNLKTTKLEILKDKGAAREKKPYTLELFKEVVYIGTHDGIVTFSDDEKKLVPFSGNHILTAEGGKSEIHRLINIDNDQLWAVIYREISDNKFIFETGWFEFRGNEWQWTKWPLAGLRKAGIISSICKGPDNEIWLGADNGLFVLNFDAIRRSRHPMTVSIDRLEINGKPMRYDVSQATPVEPISYSQNSFRISFHANSFAGLGNMEYRYKLDGFNDDWSEWSTSTSAHYPKMGEGTYTIQIQARNIYGVESDVLNYEIIILPPWYRTIWAYALYFVILIVLVYLVVQLSIRRVKRQNQRLEEIVIERTSEIAEQNHQLELQKDEITQKTTDILDSIQYAKRIQNTILPAPSRLNELFHEHFVFYRPKDIVSGDFYWAREVQGKTIFSAVDCTGHGVPGSLVSIVGNNGLVRAVNEFRLTEPHEILDKLREIVIEAFRSEGQIDVKDGMDIALCSIDYETETLKFSGANNECVIIRAGEVIELKPDKQPIGSYIDAKPFTQKDFQLEDGDLIYLYTDGYVDQFGGDKAKKFKSRPFKIMLTELARFPMNRQLEEIQRTFDEWKGNLEQIDDVCVFGVRYIKKK